MAKRWAHQRKRPPLTTPFLLHELLVGVRQLLLEVRLPCVELPDQLLEALLDIELLRRTRRAEPACAAASRRIFPCPAMAAHAPDRRIRFRPLTPGRPRE